MKKFLLITVNLFLLLSSCVAVKPYELQFVNDEDMQFECDSGCSFQNYVESIREGAVPVGSSKGSGGCGCN